MCSFAAVIAMGLTTACTSPGRDAMPLLTRHVDVTLNHANFEVLSTHNVGRAYQDWVLLAIYTGGDDEPLTKAWGDMKQQAGVEGLPAEFVNVTVDLTSEWVVFPFFSRDVWTVSADAIVFRDGAGNSSDAPGRATRGW